jgi:hypothetical protein
MASVINLMRETAAYWKPLAIALLLAGPGSTSAAWQEASPNTGGGAPADGGFTDFNLFPSQLNFTSLSLTAEAGNQGVWRSDDAAVSWAQQISGSDYNGTAIKPASTEVVLAGRTGDVIVRTEDDGVTFSDTLSGSFDNWVITFSTNSPSTVYAGGSSGLTGTFLSSIDGGATWTSSAVGVDSNPAILAIAVDSFISTTVYAAAMSSVGGFEDGLYKSEDGGASWTHISSLDFSQIDGLTIDPNDNVRIYASSLVEGGTIRRSVDGGTLWDDLHNTAIAGHVSGFTVANSVAVNANDNSIIYAAGGSGTARVILTTDCGLTWTDADPSDELGAGDATKVEIDHLNGVVYVLTGGVLYRDDLESISTGTCADSLGGLDSGDDTDDTDDSSDDSSGDISGDSSDVSGIDFSELETGSSSMFYLVFIFGLLAFFKKRNA